jgi:hypothetical protein
MVILIEMRAVRAIALSAKQSDFARDLFEMSPEGAAFNDGGAEAVTCFEARKPNSMLTSFFRTGGFITKCFIPKCNG